MELWYEEAARSVFAKVHAAEPIMEQPLMIPFNKVNNSVDHLMSKGGWKPIKSTSIKKLSLAPIPEIWKMYVAFVEKDVDAKSSVVMIQCYGHKKVREVADAETTFPHRAMNFHW